MKKEKRKEIKVKTKNKNKKRRKREKKIYKEAKTETRSTLKERLNVIYEDSSMLVIEKASGLIVQPVKNFQEVSAVELIRHYWKSQKKRQGYIGVVHRLDKETSGLMVFAKNRIAHRNLQQQFFHRKISKKYLALVDGVPHKSRGRLTGYIGRDIKGKRTVFSEETKGQEAITRYKIVEKFQNKALLELSLETGRTHQIRIQFAKIACPVLGDPFYGREKGVRVGDYKRCALHSWRLKFQHPETTKKVEFEASLPNDMLEVLNDERKRDAKNGISES